MTHVTCRLTAENRDQLRNLTLGDRVWATFTFLTESLLTPDFGSEFTTAGAEHRNARFANVFVKG